MLSPVVALAAWVACVLLSRKAAVVFTPSYREVVDCTPYLDPRRASDLDRASRRTLRLTVRNPSDPPTTVAFRFATAGEVRTLGRAHRRAGRAASRHGRTWG